MTIKSTLRSGSLSLVVFAAFGLAWTTSGHAQTVPRSAPFTITAFSVTRDDPTTCNWRWAATIRNDTGAPATINGANRVYVATTGGETAVAADSWSPLGSHSLGAVSPGQSVDMSFIFIHPGRSQFRLAVHKSYGQTVTKTVSLPPFPTAATSALVFTGLGARGTSFSVSVKNQLPEGFPAGDLGLQVESRPGADGPWTPAGGTQINCVVANGTFTYARAEGKPADHRFVRAQVRRGMATLFEKVFESSDPIPKVVAVAPASRR